MFLSGRSELLLGRHSSHLPAAFASACQLFLPVSFSSLCVIQEADFSDRFNEHLPCLRGLGSGTQASLKFHISFPFLFSLNVVHLSSSPRRSSVSWQVPFFLGNLRSQSQNAVSESLGGSLLHCRLSRTTCERPLLGSAGHPSSCVLARRFFVKFADFVYQEPDPQRRGLIWSSLRHSLPIHPTYITLL